VRHPINQMAGEVWFVLSMSMVGAIMTASVIYLLVTAVAAIDPFASLIIGAVFGPIGGFTVMGLLLVAAENEKYGDEE
jgi:hypothetical protein